MNPFVNLSAALARTTLGGEVLGAEERLTLAEALSAYTENGAYACGVDDRLGTLEPGKVADIAVLNGDPLQAGVADLKDVEADLTLLAGRVVFDRQGEVR